MITTLELNHNCVEKMLNFVANAKQFGGKRNIKIKEAQIRTMNAFQKLLSCTCKKLGGIEVEKIINLIYPNVKGTILTKARVKNWLKDAEKITLEYDAENRVLSFIVTRFCKEAGRYFKSGIVISDVLNEAVAIEMQKQKEAEEYERQYEELLRRKKKLVDITRYVRQGEEFLNYNNIIELTQLKNRVAFAEYNGYYRWEKDNLNKLFDTALQYWEKWANYQLQEYQKDKEYFFSDERHKELVDDAFIKEIKGVETTLIEKTRKDTQEIKECFNRLANEINEAFSNEALRFEFAVKLFHDFYYKWMARSRRIGLDDFIIDMANTEAMLNSFDINLLEKERIFDLWDKMAELLKVKKSKKDVYTNEDRLDKVKELKRLAVEDGGICCWGSLFYLVNKSDAEIDDLIVYYKKQIEEKKQEKIAKEEFERNASTVRAMDKYTKEAEECKVATGCLIGYYTPLEGSGGLGYTRHNAVIIDIDVEKNQIQVIHECGRQYWLNCDEVYNIGIYPLRSCSLYLHKRNQIIGDLLPFFQEQAKKKGLYFTQN